MNTEAGLKTKQEYLDNYEAIKGPEARQFIEHVATAFACCDTIAAALTGKAPPQIGIEAMVDLLSANIALLAEKAGLSDEDAEALCDDARTMVDAVTEAAETRILRVQ